MSVAFVVVGLVAGYLVTLAAVAAIDHAFAGSTRSHVRLVGPGLAHLAALVAGVALGGSIAVSAWGRRPATEAWGRGTEGERWVLEVRVPGQSSVSEIPQYRSEVSSSCEVSRVTPAPNGHDVARRVESALRAVLPRAVKVEPAGTTSTADLLINGVPVEVKWVGEGWLRDVRDILARRRHRPDIVVARRLSPGAREALSRAGIGWLDETGAAEVVIGPIVVSRTGQPLKVPEKPGRWTRSVLAVAEALLCGAKASVSAVEEATGLSSGSCTTALRFLADRGLLAAEVARGRESARRVVDPDQLLDAYASAAAAIPPKASLQVGVTWQDVVVGLLEIGRSWDRSGVLWATTGAAASLVLAPYLTSVGTAEVFVEARTPAELQAVAAQAALRPIEGGRLTLTPFPTVTARRLATAVDGLRVAPWPRVFADLRTTGVRGEEAAEHLRGVMRGR